MNSYSSAIIGACKAYPNMSPAVFSLIPRETTKVPIAAVDQYWRLYVNPDAFDKLPFKQKVAIILHETMHLVLKHFARAEAICLSEGHYTTWNEAADSVINHALRSDGFTLPDGGVYPETLGLSPGMSTEHVFRALCQRAQQQQDSGQGAQDDNAESNQGGDSQQGGSSQPADSDPDSQGQSGGGDANSATGPDDSADGSHAGDGSPDGDSHDSDSGAGAAAGDAAEAGAAGTGGDGHSATAAEGTGATVPWQGGSCSDGVPRPWEEGPPRSFDEGRLEHQGDAIAKQVAERTRKSQGKGRGNSRLLIDEIPTLILNPYRELLRKIKKSSEQVRGAGIRNYRRLSRISPRDVLIGQSKAPVPKITVILDTSGSMSARELAMGVALLKKIIDSLKLRQGVRFVTGDSFSQSKEVVYRHANRVDLRGGGGTNMRRIACQVISDPLTKPELLVIVTDGWTPWPTAEDLCGIPCVAAITSGNSDCVPDHIEYVDLAKTAQFN